MEKNQYLEGTPEEFYTKNEKLIHYSIRGYRQFMENKGVSYDDLFGEAIGGFLHAYQNYNPSTYSKPYAFSSYAVKSIQGRINNFIRDNMEIIHVSNNIKKFHKELVDMDILHKSVEDIMEITGRTYYMVTQAQEYDSLRHVESLDKELGGKDGEALPLANVVPAKSIDVTKDLIISDFLDSLKPIEKKVVCLMVQGYTQLEIEKMVGLSSLTIRRYFDKSIESAKIYGRNFKGKKSSEMEDELQSSYSNLEEKDEEDDLHQKNLESLKRAFWGEEKENELSREEKASILVKDVQLSMQEIIDITGLTFFIVSKIKNNYLDSITIEEKEIAINELLLTTSLTNYMISRRMQCDIRIVDAIEEMQNVNKLRVS